MKSTLTSGILESDVEHFIDSSCGLLKRLQSNVPRSHSLETGNISLLELLQAQYTYLERIAQHKLNIHRYRVFA